MSDLFTGAGSGTHEKGLFTERGNNAYVAELNFKPMVEVSLYSFFEEFAPQVISRVAVDLNALYTATAEVLSGVSTGLGKSLLAGYKAVGNALDVDGDGKYTLSDVQVAGKVVAKKTYSGVKAVGKTLHKAFDANQDGKINLKDVTAVGSSAATKIQATLRGKKARAAGKDKAAK